MNIIVKHPEEFERQAQRFAKKNKTFVNDFTSFLITQE